MTKQYSEESIFELEGAKSLRAKPSSLLGSDGLQGSCHTFLEILANSIDEAREGHGAVIEVFKHKDNSITIKDYGRGCPLDWNEKSNKYNYELVFMTLYASGKYKTNEGENYEYSLGTNGLGATATQYTSKFMNVVVQRDGCEYKIDFEKGYPASELIKNPCDKKMCGTSITWIPDLEVFLENNIPSSFIEENLERQAMINSGLRLKFINEVKDVTKEYYYENGIKDYVFELNQKGLTEVLYFEKEGKGKEREDREEYKTKLNIALCFNNNVNAKEYYHNGSYLEDGGTPEEAMKSALTNVLDKYMRANGLYKTKQEKISFQDIEESLIFVSSTFSTFTSYKEQTKKAITNKFVKEFMNQIIRENLEIYLVENKETAILVCNQILANKRSREKSDVDRIKIRKELEGKVTSSIDRPKKLTPCRSKNPKEKEIIFIEGDSAEGAVKTSRDKITQAIFPLKGKPMNCLKQNLNKILANEEVRSIFKIAGCGMSYKGKNIKNIPPFDISKLEYDKLIIFTDGDEDGFHIRTLFLCMMYVLAKDLINEGKIYVLEAPLYRIISKGKTDYAYSEMEYQDMIKDLDKFEEQRFKGLGGMNAKMLNQTCMNKENRRLLKVTIEDAEEAKRYMEMFLDDDSLDRKEYIEEHGSKYFDYSIYEG